MEEGTQDNSGPTEQDLKLAEDATPVCPNCLHPCDPLTNYCPNCGSNETINPLASYMPFVDLRFRIGMIGKVWRKTWAQNTPMLVRAVYIGLLILFYPFFLIVGLGVLIYEKIKSKKPTADIPQER